MTSARPRGFHGYGGHDAVVSPDGGGGAEVLGYIEGHEVDSWDADRVIVGGGLPDEGVELSLAVRDHRALFEGVDVCVKTNDAGDRVVWLAP